MEQSFRVTFTTSQTSMIPFHIQQKYYTRPFGACGNTSNVLGLVWIWYTLQKSTNFVSNFVWYTPNANDIDYVERLVTCTLFPILCLMKGPSLSLYPQMEILSQLAAVHVVLLDTRLLCSGHQVHSTCWSSSLLLSFPSFAGLVVKSYWLRAPLGCDCWCIQSPCHSLPPVFFALSITFVPWLEYVRK